MPTVRRLDENLQSARKRKLRIELGRLAREEKQEQRARLTAEYRMCLDKWRAKSSTPLPDPISIELVQVSLVEDDVADAHLSDSTEARARGIHRGAGKTVGHSLDREKESAR
jgi:hypothetical protein